MAEKAFASETFSADLNVPEGPGVTGEGRAPHPVDVRGYARVGCVHALIHELVCCHQVFVEYANSSDSKEAQRLLTGRTFDGKFVVATFYPLSAYRRGYLYQTVQ